MKFTERDLQQIAFERGSNRAHVCTVLNGVPKDVEIDPYDVKLFRSRYHKDLYDYAGFYREGFQSFLEQAKNGTGLAAFAMELDIARLAYDNARRKGAK